MELLQEYNFTGNSLKTEDHGHTSSERENY
jgi:hypothetical protein